MKTFLPALSFLLAIQFSYTKCFAQLSETENKNTISLTVFRVINDRYHDEYSLRSVIFPGLSYERNLGNWIARGTIYYNQMGKMEEVASLDNKPSEDLELSIGIGREFFLHSFIRPLSFLDLSFQDGRGYARYNGFGCFFDSYSYSKSAILYAGAGLEIEPIKNILLRYEGRIGLGYSHEKAISYCITDPSHPSEYSYFGFTAAFEPINALSLGVRF